MNANVLSLSSLALGLERIAPGTLYPHQLEGVTFLLSKKRALLANDMGLGKTRQAIVAKEIGAPEGAILIVCPASLKLNWRREIRLVFPDATIEVVGIDAPQSDAPR